MAHATEIAAWRPLPGTGRSLTAGSGSSVSDSVAMGKQTYACQVSATTFAVVITIAAGAGVAATAVHDMLIKVSDPPLVLRCAPGDTISAYGIGGAGVLYITELTH